MHLIKSWFSCFAMLFVFTVGCSNDTKCPPVDAAQGKRNDHVSADKKVVIEKDVRHSDGIEKEKNLIRQTLQYFFDGLDNVDEKTISKAFHPKAYLLTVSPRGLVEIPVSKWYPQFPKIKEQPNHPFVKHKSKKEIVYIHVSGNAASAKVNWVFPDFTYEDFYNLLKVDERWYIVNKIWHETKHTQ